MPRDDAQAARESAARINDLILQLWIAIEREGPRHDEGLTSKQQAVLGLVVARPTITPAELSEALGVTRGAISQHLGALERAGYISRRRSDDDGRVHVICLQRRGREYQECFRRFERDTVDRYLARLAPGDLTMIVGALQKLQTALES